MFIKLIVITLIGIFYITYFAKMINQRIQGIKTNQLGKGKNGLEKFIEYILKFVSIFMPIVQIIFIIIYTGKMPNIVKGIGVVILIIADIIFLLAILQMNNNWRAGVPVGEKNSLVTSGIYSISRNPAFLAFDLMHIGILINFYNCLLFMLTVFSILIFHLQIVKVEEKYLINTFGEEYLCYCRNVNRYL